MYLNGDYCTNKIKTKTKTTLLEQFQNPIGKSLERGKFYTPNTHMTVHCRGLVLTHQ